jgi:hypothetical protein
MDAKRRRELADATLVAVQHILGYGIAKAVLLLNSLLL